jgi:ligand-binding sensor domain-containing protein
MALVTSCIGQNKENIQKNNPIESNTIGTKYAKVTTTQPTKNALAENVHCSLLDKSGNLWFGTTGHGVFKFDGESFTSYTVKDGLSSNHVVSICEDKDGNILFAGGKVITYYDGESIREFAKNEDFGKGAIVHLYEDKKGQLWVATDDMGICIYDGKTVTNHLPNDNISHDFNLTLNGISGMTEDKNGNFWFASWATTDEGIVQYDGKSLIKFREKKGIYDSIIHDVIEDKTGIIWVGSRDNGVFSYDGNLFTHMSDKNGPGNATIYSVLEDKKGNIWFTTDENGVYRYDGKSFENYTTEDGLIHNSVFSIVEDNNGNLWFGTRNVGLCRFDGKSFVNYSE